MPGWVKFWIVVICFCALFVWHVVVSVRERKALPPGSMNGRLIGSKAMLGLLDRPAQRVFNRMFVRAILICLAMFPLLLLLEFIDRIISGE